MGYKQKAFAGFGSQTALKVVSNGATLLKMMILARLLTPEQFGVFSIVMIAVGISESITQTGVNLTILQSRHPLTYFLNTAWVVAIARGLLISLVMIGLGYVLSLFFNNPELFFLIAWASLIPAIKGLINPSIISLYKELKFWSDGTYRLALVLTETVFAIGLIWWSQSVVAWIGSLILAAIVEVIISFVCFKHRPKFIFSSEPAKVIFANAKWLSLSTLLGYLNENLDNLILGKAVGTYALGIYQNGYSLSHEVNYELAKSAHHGTLPIYTQIKDDRKRWQHAIFKTWLTTGILMAVASLPLVLAGKWLIPFIFGPQWLGVVPILPWLVIAGLLQAVSMLGYTVLYAKGSLKAINIHAVLNLLAMTMLMLWWSQTWGLMGAVVGLVIARLMALPVLGWAVTKAMK